MDENQLAIAKLDDAINRGNYTEVRRLLDQGYDPNGRDVVGDTMLMNAAWVAAVDIVALLIERGAEINAHGSNGKTALHRLLALDE